MAMVKGVQDGNTYWMQRDGDAVGLDAQAFDECDKPECHWKSYVTDLIAEARKHNPLNGKWTGDLKEAKSVTIEDDGHF